MYSGILYRSTAASVLSDIHPVFHVLFVMLVLNEGGKTHDLQFDGLALEFDSTDLEVNANRGDVALRVGVVGKPEQQA